MAGGALVHVRRCVRLSRARRGDLLPSGSPAWGSAVSAKPDDFDDDGPHGARRPPGRGAAGGPSEASPGPEVPSLSSPDETDLLVGADGHVSMSITEGPRPASPVRRLLAAARPGSRERPNGRRPRLPLWPCYGACRGGWSVHPPTAPATPRSQTPLTEPGDEDAGPGPSFGLGKPGTLLLAPLCSAIAVRMTFPGSDPRQL